ncbi:hypothetical protein GCM10011366_11710 [Ornithinimicrobium tianjinense]|uniref:Uncharacterized protein n=2 Tax=Ornithinimicrobium tianjinense TaxID=1195761 RepID=A0A917BIQ0_9MICO|nr:hypothetical protein GCM10011366_11710 [Ornithinimicrobium tianjinense]
MTTDDIASPVVQVVADQDVLHATLLAPSGVVQWPDPARRDHLLSLGWQATEGGTAYRMQLPRTHAHLLAAVLTDTLQEVVGTPHPAFLDAGALSISAPDEPQPAEEAPRPQIDLDQAVLVDSPAELREAVETTLHAALGHPPRRDADGDIPILYGSALVYVRTADSQPVVSIFAIVVQDVGDLEAARREVLILSRRSVFTKFHLVGRQIIASVAIPSLPFVPRHLVGMVELVGRELDALDDDLALLVHGRRWLDVMSGSPAPPTGPEQDAPDLPTHQDEAPLPQELLTLLQMDAHGTGVAPAVVAEVCHRDRALILRLVRLAEEQTISCRRSVQAARSTGDVDAARAATGELRGWQSTVKDLRAALRHLVSFGPGPDADSS